MYVDAIITVVDSPQFFEMYERESLIPEDDFGRGYSQLLAEQIEGADILLLNKIDKTPKNEIKKTQKAFTAYESQSNYDRN